MKVCLFYLTCADDWEADKISKALLSKRLIVCAKKLPVISDFLWKGKVTNSSEVLLILESVEENFDKINKEIKKLHSYETFVLLTIPVSKTTKEVEKWMRDELKLS